MGDEEDRVSQEAEEEVHASQEDGFDEGEIEEYVEEEEAEIIEETVEVNTTGNRPNWRFCTGEWGVSDCTAGYIRPLHKPPFTRQATADVLPIVFSQRLEQQWTK